MNVNTIIEIIKDLNADPGYINEEYLRGQIELLVYMMGFQEDNSATYEYIENQLNIPGYVS